MQETSSSNSVIPAKAGSQEEELDSPRIKYGAGLVKPGRTNPKVLRKCVPGAICQFGSEAIASTFLTPLECQFMQLMG